MPPVFIAEQPYSTEEKNGEYHNQQGTDIHMLQYSLDPPDLSIQQKGYSEAEKGVPKQQLLSRGFLLPSGDR